MYDMCCVYITYQDALDSIYKSFNQGPAGVLAEECWYLWECDKVLAPDVEREDSFKDEPGSTILRLQSYLVRKASHLTPRVVIFI